MNIMIYRKRFSDKVLKYLVRKPFKSYYKVFYRTIKGYKHRYSDEMFYKELFKLNIKHKDISNIKNKFAPQYRMRINNKSNIVYALIDVTDFIKDGQHIKDKKTIIKIFNKCGAIIRIDNGYYVDKNEITKAIDKYVNNKK